MAGKDMQSNPWLIVSQPGIDPSLINREVFLRLKATCDEFEARGDEFRCALCGRGARMTKEHTPSRAAGNPDSGFVYQIAPESGEAGQILWGGHPYAGGIVYPTLCKDCNGGTGADYNPAYVELVDICKAHACPGNVGKAVLICAEIYPARVAKQALTTLIASSQRGFTECRKDFRGLVLDRQAKGLPPDGRLWLNLGDKDELFEFTGFNASYDVATAKGFVFCQFYCWPIGWKLTLGEAKPVACVDVSSWLDCGYDEKRTVEIHVPCIQMRPPF